MSTLKTILAATERDELRSARRALLARPLIVQSADPEPFRLISRHRQALREWFSEQTGWKLIVDCDAGFARLHKLPVRLTPTHGAHLDGKPPFNKRRYVLFCLTLAVLEESAPQTTLARIAQELDILSSADETVERFDATVMTERRAFVDALRLLVELRILEMRDGDAETYVVSRERGDALFDINDRLLGQLISTPLPPALLTPDSRDPAALLVELYPETEDGQRQRARHRVMRRLLDEAVVYYDELEQRERDWLVHSLGFVETLLEDQVGLHPERHRDGIATIDPDGELTDSHFPDGGSSAKHAALLLCEFLAARGAAAARHSSAAVVEQAELLQIMSRLISEYGERCAWSVAYRSDASGAALLLEEALSLLERFNLVAKASGGVRPLPAIARFRAAEPRRARPGQRNAGTSQLTQEDELIA